MGNKAASNTRDSICSCLWDDGRISKGQVQIQRKRVRPLACDIEADFKRVADKDGKVRMAELSLLWQRAAERKVGKLDQKEVEYMNYCAQVYMADMDIDSSGSVDFDEFHMWMMADYEEHAVLRRMRKDLAASPYNKDLTTVKEVIKLFRSYDVNHDGFMDRSEITHLNEDLVRLCRSNLEDSDLDRENSEPKSDPETLKLLDTGLAREMAKALMKEVEVSPDGRIDLWDILAHALGRRKTPVELLLYDISDGVSRRFSPLLLGRKFEAIYHSSVLVFGSEYWFGGEVFRTVPPCTEQFGPPLRKSVTGLQPSTYYPELFVVPLGNTLTTVQEFHTFLVEEMVPKYTPQNYDVLEHNCNDFSNDLVHFLSGYGIPVEVRDLPELVMGTPTARLLRPVLNKWLGGFGKKGQNTLSRENTTVAEPKELNLFTGDIVHIDLSTDEADLGEVLASITKQDKNTVDIQYFDVAAGELVQVSGVQRNLIKRSISMRPEAKMA